MTKSKISKKNYKKRKTIRKNRKSTRRTRNGGCGCGKSFFGGNINPPSFDGGLDKSNYYPYNNEMNNPNNPSFQISGRNLPNVTRGGSKRGKSKKIKGGSYSLLGDAYSNNPVMSFGTIDGAITNANTFFSFPNVNGSTMEQPIMRGFTRDLPPLA